MLNIVGGHQKSRVRRDPHLKSSETERLCKHLDFTLQAPALRENKFTLFYHICSWYFVKAALGKKNVSLESLTTLFPL